MIRRPPTSPLSPSTTLFRSGGVDEVTARREGEVHGDQGAERDREGDDRLDLLADADGPGGGVAAEEGLVGDREREALQVPREGDRKSTRLNSSHANISDAVF